MSSVCGAGLRRKEPLVHAALSDSRGEFILLSVEDLDDLRCKNRSGGIG